jgi:hypothetical protein
VIDKTAEAMAGMYSEAQLMQREIDQSHLLSNVELANLQELTLKVTVYDRLLNPKPGSPLTLPDETECLFGQWYYGEGNEAERNADFRRRRCPIVWCTAAARRRCKPMPVASWKKP